MRFDLSPSREGVLRVLQDVMVHTSSNEELIVVGRHPGVVGDTLTVELVDADPASGIEMRVVESRPVVIDGAVRHRLRLAPVHDPGPDARGVRNMMTRLTLDWSVDEQ